jgi:hypothetical protein
MEPSSYRHAVLALVQRQSLIEPRQVPEYTLIRSLPRK